MSWEHYEEAVVRIKLRTGTVQVAPAGLGSTTGTFPDPTGDPIHIITAHNPRGQHATPDANERAHDKLLQQVRAVGLQPLSAAGADPTWTHVEESVAVLGMTEAQALSLGHVFGQDAIFAWTPTEWVVLSCTDHRRSSHGWVANPVPAPTSKGTAAEGKP